MRRVGIALLVTAACSSATPEILLAIPDGGTVADVVAPDGGADAGELPDVQSTDAQEAARDSSPSSDASLVDSARDAEIEASPPPDTGAPDSGASIGWASPCDSCVYDSPHDCAGIGAPDSGPYTAFTCAMACNNPPPTLTSGPSHCYYIGPIGPTTFEMCCPSSNPGF